MTLEIYGLVIDTDHDLHQHRPAQPGARTDVRIRAGGEVEASTDLPPGGEILRCEADGRHLYSFVRADDGEVTLRFFGACDVVVSADLAQMRVHPVRGADPGLATVLTTGASLAFQLYQRGHLVLHASAVEHDGRALGLVGPSGMGKSTLATMLCADGARLVTDDVLRVDEVSTRPVCRAGATELRLRKGADALLDRFTGARPGRRRSADGREVVRPARVADDRVPLGALVVPVPDRQARRASVERLETRQALLALLSVPRLVGWRDPRVLREQFELGAALVRRVPVLVARLPWGPPFAPELTDRLLAGVGEHLPEDARPAPTPAR